MQWKKTLYRFQLDDDPIFDNQIKAVTSVDVTPLIVNREMQLADKTKIAQSQFNAQALLISRLKQTGTENPVHIYRRPNNFFG